MTATLLALSNGCNSTPTAAKPQPIVIGPYLDNYSANSLLVRWSSDQQADGVVRWSESGKQTEGFVKAEARPFRYLNEIKHLKTAAKDIPESAYAETYFYSARLEGLQPGTVYDYSVEFAGQYVAAQFRTPPAKPEPFTFIAFSDTHCSDVVASSFAAYNPALLINDGDLVNREFFPQYRQFFTPAVNAAIARFPMWVARGNHDQMGDMLKELFTYPDNRLYYSFDYGNVHFVCLDSCLWRWPGAEANIAAMMEWCEADLRASKADWKVVYFHEPPYDMSYRRTDWGRKEALPVLRRNGVDLIFCGHVHCYQRFQPLYWPGQNDEHPISLVLCSGAGNQYIAMPRRAEPYLAVSTNASHFVVCKVDGESLELRAVTPDGSEIDKLLLQKREGRLDSTYIASALPEETFGLIEQSLASLTTSRLAIAEGEEFTLSLKLKAGSEAYEFEFQPAQDSLKVAELTAPVKGTVPANGSVAVKLPLRAKRAIAKQEKGNRAEPIFALECHFSVGERKGIISSEVLRMNPPPATAAQ